MQNEVFKGKQNAKAEQTSGNGQQPYLPLSSTQQVLPSGHVSPSGHVTSLTVAVDAMGDLKEILIKPLSQVCC